MGLELRDQGEIVAHDPAAEGFLGGSGVQGIVERAFALFKLGQEGGGAVFFFGVMWVWNADELRGQVTDIHMYIFTYINGPEGALGLALQRRRALD